MEALLQNVLVIPFTVLTVLAFGAVIRRLLGVRVGPVRTILGALLAFLLAGPLLYAMLPAPLEASTGTRLVFLTLAVAWASLVAMVVLVIAEVLLPEGSLPGPVELWRSWHARVARTRRYVQILRILVRHGLARFLRGQRHSGLDSSAFRRELARSLRQALDEGGVTFVKLGQQLSTRRDLIPAEFVEELSALQDNAAPIPWDTAKTVLRAELGDQVDDVVSWVDPEPLAAASVAQVHAGRLATGEDIVIKIQRPGITDLVERDLDILFHLARTLEGRTQWARSLGLQELARGFAKALREELDFTVERENLRAMGAMSSRRIRVPTPYDGWSSARVLVMEKLTGTPLTVAEPLLARLGAEKRQAIAGSLLDAVLDQVLVRGMFHVDLHPGNVLVASDGTLGVLDLGSVGRIDGSTRTAIGRLMAALGRADSLAASDALLELVDRPDDIDERNLERAVGGLIVRFTVPGTTPGVAAFSALFRLVTSYRLAIPPQVAAVFRTFATLEGTLVAIDPDFDLVAQARELGRKRAVEAVEPARARQAAEAELAALLPLVRRLPRRVDRIADAVEHGRVTVNVSLFADVRDRRVVTDLIHEALLTVIGAAAGIMGVMLLGLPGGPQVTESVGLFALFGYGLLIIAVVLVLRVLIVIFRRDPPGLQPERPSAPTWQEG
jgi:ubiquinone biosynthesis protein